MHIYLEKIKYNNLMRQIIILFFIILTSCYSSVNQTINTKISNDSILILAQKYYEQRDYINSLNLYNQLIKYDSLNGELFYRRGNCKGQLQDYIESNKDYKNAIRLKYKNLGNVYYNIALNFYANEIDTMALYYFNLALKEDPDDEDIKKQIEKIKANIERNKCY
jgi:tetratricopeptide (TPR) repeat protein